MELLTANEACGGIADGFDAREVLVRRVEALVGRVSLLLQGVDVTFNSFELVAEGRHQFIGSVHVGFFNGFTGGDLCFEHVDGTIRQDRGFVTRHRAVALERSVRVAFDDTVFGKLVDGIVRPAVQRDVGEGTGLRNIVIGVGRRRDG
jgi:hypothetical protein